MTGICSVFKSWYKQLLLLKWNKSVEIIKAKSKHFLNILVSAQSFFDHRIIEDIWKSSTSPNLKEDTDIVILLCGFPTFLLQFCRHGKVMK